MANRLMSNDKTVGAEMLWQKTSKLVSCYNTQPDQSTALLKDFSSCTLIASRDTEFIPFLYSQHEADLDLDVFVADKRVCTIRHSPKYLRSKGLLGTIIVGIDDDGRVSSFLARDPETTPSARGYGVSALGRLTIKAYIEERATTAKIIINRDEPYELSIDKNMSIKQVIKNLGYKHVTARNENGTLINIHDSCEESLAKGKQPVIKITTNTKSYQKLPECRIEKGGIIPNHYAVSVPAMRRDRGWNPTFEFIWKLSRG